MKAMVLKAPRTPLQAENLPDPIPQRGQVRIKVEACAVCRTDLHVIDGDLPDPKLPLIPGHEIVGVVEDLGDEVTGIGLGERVGVPWLAHTCGICSYCRAHHENLCDDPQFTGYTRDGGFATKVIADGAYTLPMTMFDDPVAAAPLLCAGLIGWRSLNAAGTGQRIGLYGFGAAAHVVAQLIRWQGREFYAFTRSGDVGAQDLAQALGAAWAGASTDEPPELLDAAIIFAPVGSLVPVALRAVRKGGRVVCGGIYMSDIPQFPYHILWEERQILSVANLTRQDGRDFLAVAQQAKIKTHTRRYSLETGNEALSDLRAGRIQGAAVLIP